MPPVIKLRFHQVDLHGEPFFAPGQSIAVEEGMTVIAGHIMISQFDSRAPHLELRINEDGSIDVMDTSGQALDNRSYNGASDCKELALAVILSVRKIW